MKRNLFALALALSVIPVAALAQDANAPGPSDAQHQQMMQAFHQFAQAEGRLHDQLRWQILRSLTPVHRRAVGAEIGALAVSQNPDVDAAAQQLDRILSPGERQRILAAHAAYAEQSRQLHDQMRTQMESMMPSGHPPMDEHQMANGPEHRQLDAGHVLLFALVPHGHDMGPGHGMMMMHPDGPAGAAPPR